MSEFKTALMLCQTIFNFQFNDQDIYYNLEIKQLDQLKIIYLFLTEETEYLNIAYLLKLKLTEEKKNQNFLGPQKCLYQV